MILTTRLTIDGMMCGNCTRHVETALRAIKGVQSVCVDLEAKSATVEHFSSTEPQALIAAITEEGYEGRLDA